MAHVEPISLTLPRDLATLVKDAVREGSYASPADVVREALLEWGQRRGEGAWTDAELGALWDEGVAQGHVVDGPEALALLRSRIEGTGNGL